MPRSPIFFFVAAVFVAVATGGPTDLAAQRSDNGTTEDLIESFDQTTTDSSSEGLPEASLSRINLDLNLRHWRENLAAGETDHQRLRQLVADTRGYGFRNAPEYAAAVARAADQIKKEGREGPLRSAEIFEAAQSMAPDLPYPHLAEADYLLDHAPSRVERLVGSYVDAVRKAVIWPNTRSVLAAYGLLAIVVFLAAGFGVVLIGQTLRHLPLAAHDVSRRLPDAVSRGQVVAGIILAGGAAILWTHSYLIGAAGLVALASLTQSWSERVVAIGAALFVAALPFTEGEIKRLASFSESDAHTLLEAQYIRCGEECRGRLAERFEAHSDDPLVRYTRALALVRAGSAEGVARAETLVGKPNSVPTSLRGHFSNLRGAALLAAGQPKPAIEAFQRATAQMTDPVPAWFNLMRAARRAGRDAMASKASTEASERDAGAVQRQSEMERKDPASYLMIPPLPVSSFWQRHWQRQRTATIDADRDSTGGTVISQAWASVAGPNLPFERASQLGLGAALVLLLLSVFSTLRLVSSPCPNCGLAREPDDGDKTGGHPHCLPCYRTFVGGAELGYRARVHYETLLERRSTIQMVLRRGLSVLVPGAGHALAGRVFAGFALAATLGLGVFLTVYPDWLWQPSRSIAGPDFLGLRWLGVVLVGFTAIFAVWAARRDIEPVDPSSDQREARRE